MNNIRSLAYGVLVVTAGGCATARPPAELVNARAAYTAAEVTATSAAPTELHAARIALDHAEASFVHEAGGVEVRDLAYVAQRRAELASTNAAIFTTNARRDASNVRLRSLGAEAATALKTTMSDLSDAQQRARVATRDNTGLKNDINGLQTDLKVAESKSDDLKTQLATQTEARRQSEARLTSTLQAMHDLQSVKEEPRGLVITLSGAVLFASGKAVLLPAARSALDNVAEALKASPGRAIAVEGHTDSQGSPSSNMDLSLRRGESVRSYLITRGIPEANIRAAGFGQDRAIADNATAEGRANNRRVEIVLAPAPAEAR